MIIKSSSSLKINLPITLLFLFSVCSTALLAQDSLATVYFYREGKFAGSFVGYDVMHNGTTIGRIKSNSVFTYQSKGGLQTFMATTEGASSMKIELAPGNTYFIECGLGVGVMVGRPTFRQATNTEARKKIEKINSVVANAIPANIQEVVQPNDTVRALQNLFQRKRKGGTARAAVFGVIAVASLVGIANYKQATVTINQGSAGSQVIPIGSSSPPAANFILAGFSAIMTITGITQTSKYADDKLEALLQVYKNGKPLPPIIKSKLKKKDFK